MKLITVLCCLCLTQPDTRTQINHTLFPIANSHNEYHQMSTAFSPPTLPPDKPTLHTLHTIFMLCLRKRIHGLVICKKPGNHWLSLVLMKENNSLTRIQDCSKTAFFDEWHFPSSGYFLCFQLINKAAPQRVRQGSRKVCVYGRVRSMCVCARLNFRCLNCQVRFWDSDLRTARFSHTSCSAIYRFLLWQSTRKLVDCQSKVEVFFFFFFQTLNIKRVKSKKAEFPAVRCVTRKRMRGSENSKLL